VDPAFRPDSFKASEFCARYNLASGSFVLAVGSLTADKRYEFLFEVMRQLGSEAPPLVICGGGPLEDKLRAQAAGLPIDVRLLGLVDPDLLPGAYTAATIFVHACEIETFGLSVLEAMACGCPVLAIDGGAVPEVLGNAGVLVPVNDSKGYADALHQLMSNSSLRGTLSKAARERARRFSLHHMQQSYADAVEQAADHVRAAPSRP